MLSFGTLNSLHQRQVRSLYQDVNNNKNNFKLTKQNKTLSIYPSPRVYIGDIHQCIMLFQGLSCVKNGYLK